MTYSLGEIIRILLPTIQGPLEARGHSYIAFTAGVQVSWETGCNGGWPTYLFG